MNEDALIEMLKELIKNQEKQRRELYNTDLSIASLMNQLKDLNPDALAKLNSTVTAPILTTTIPVYFGGEGFSARTGMENKIISFLNDVKTAMRISELEWHLKKSLQMYSYEPISMSNIMRKLQKERRVILTKLNESTKLSFWALPEWVKNGKLKDDFKPEKYKEMDFIINQE